MPRRDLEIFDRSGLIRSTGLILAAIIGLAVAGCDRQHAPEARADAARAADDAGAAVHAAADATRDTVQDLSAAARPAVQRAGDDARRGVDQLTVAAGRATAHAGRVMERAGQRERRNDLYPDRNQGD